MIALTGVSEPSPTAGDASNDHYIANNDGRIVLRARNTGGGAQTITFKTKYNIQGMTLGDNPVSVINGGVKWVGPFSPGIFDSTGGSLHIDVAESTWEFLAFHVPAAA